MTALVLIGLVLIGVVVGCLVAWAQRQDAPNRFDDVDFDLRVYRVRRRIQARQLKMQIHRDAVAARRRLHRDLREHRTGE